MLSVRATTRFGLLASVASTALVLALIPKHLDGTHIKRFPIVPSAFYSVTCDTNGIAMHHLAEQIESLKTADRASMAQRNEMASQNARNMRDVLAALDTHKLLDNELTRQNLEAYKKIYDRSQSAVLALDQTLVNNSTQLQQYQTELSARRNGDVLPRAIKLSGFSDDWGEWIGLHGYEQYYHAQLKWHAYIALVVAICAGTMGAVLGLRYLSIALLMAFSSAARWVVGGTRSGQD